MAALRTFLRWRRRLGPAPGAQPARRLWAGGGAGAAGLRRWRRELGWAAAGGALAGYVGYRLSERRREPSREPAAAEPGGARALLPIPVAAAAKETVGVCAPRPSRLTARRPLASVPRSAGRLGVPGAPPGAVSCLGNRPGPAGMEERRSPPLRCGSVSAGRRRGAAERLPGLSRRGDPAWSRPLGWEARPPARAGFPRERRAEAGACPPSSHQARRAVTGASW